MGLTPQYLIVSMCIHAHTYKPRKRVNKMSSKNGKNGKASSEAVVSEVSLSFAHNNDDIRNGFNSGRISVYATHKEKEYRLTSIQFDIVLNKYVCNVTRLTDNVAGKLKFNGDHIIKYVVKTPKNAPKTEEPKVEVVKPEVKPEVKKPEVKTEEPTIAITFPTLRSIADKLQAIDKAVNDERAKTLLDRLNTLQADLLDYFAGSPESKPATEVKPEVKVEPKTETSTPKTEKPENSTKTPRKRDTETRESKKQKWDTLKAINSLVKAKEMSAAEAAVKHNMSPNSISAHLAAYRLCLKHVEVRKAWISGDITWNTIRNAAQVQKMLGETLTLEVAMGRISLDDAKAKAQA